MKTLAVLPIPTKNMLEESRVLSFIQRWAQTKTLPHPAEMDGYSSENTSRAQTPLNTPDGSSTKQGPELDGDASKPAVYRRLKIISENSLDSALSDASKASDGKEEEDDDEDDDEEEDKSSNSGLPDGKRLKEEPVGEAADPTKGTMEESVKEESPQKEEEPGMSLRSQQQPQVEEVQEKTELDLEKEIEIKADTSEGQSGELEGPKEPSEDQECGEEQTPQPVTEKVELEGDKPTAEVLDSENQSIQTDVAALPPEGPSENKEPQVETQEAEKPPPCSEEQPGESTTDAAPCSETTEASVPCEVIATAGDPSVIGTPSQDEEEGVSDVESERSQEPPLSALDIGGMAARLLDSWKDLKVSSNRFPFLKAHLVQHALCKR